MVSGKVGISMTATVLAINPGMKEQDLVKELKRGLKEYIEGELDAKTITGTNIEGYRTQMKKIGEPTLASFIVSYLSLVQQEKGDESDTKIQRRILYVAIASVISSICSVIVALFK